MSDRTTKRFMIGAAIVVVITWIPIIAGGWSMLAEEYHSSQAFKFAVEGDCKSALHHAARGKAHRLDLVERFCPVRP